MSSKTVRGRRFVLSVVGFERSCPYEAYAFTKENGENVKDGYHFHIRQKIDRGEDITGLTEAGFVMYFNKRMSKSRDERLLGSDDWGRYLFVRHLPGNAPSTAETRQEGLNMMAAYLMNPANSRYPPLSIEKVDQTNASDPVSMDTLLLDIDIVHLMGRLFDEDILTDRFAVEFAEYASAFFSPPYAGHIEDRFGYRDPSSSRPGAAASFVLPNAAPTLAGSSPALQAGREGSVSVTHAAEAATDGLETNPPDSDGQDSQGNGREGGRASSNGKKRRHK